MDDLIELLLELLEVLGIVVDDELLNNKKIPKWIRYIIMLVLISIVIGVIVFGIVILKTSIIGGIIIISISIFLLVCTIIKIKNYLKK